MAGSQPRSLSFLGSLLRTRTATGICAGFAVLQTSLIVAGITAIPCWFHQWTGRDCPLCGISRSVGELARGHVHAGLAWHPFGPVAVLLASILCIAAVLPERHRLALSSRIEQVEQRTAISAVLMFLLFAHWIVRIAAT